MSETIKPTLLLLHGTGLDGGIWNGVAANIDTGRFNYAAPSLEISDARLSLDDLGEQIVDYAEQEIDPRSKLYLVCHSRTINAGAIAVNTMLEERMRDETELEIIGFCPSFQPQTLGLSEFDRFLPDKNTSGYRDEVHLIGDESSMVTEEAAKEYIFPNCAEPLATQIARRMRPQRSAKMQGCSSRWREVAYISILADNDRVVDLLHSIYIDFGILKVQPTILRNSDHCPMLSRPETVARELMKISGTRSDEKAATSAPGAIDLNPIQLYSYLRRLGLFPATAR